MYPFSDYELRNVIAGQAKIKQEIDRFYRERDGNAYVYVDGIAMRFYFGYSGDAQLF